MANPSPTQKRVHLSPPPEVDVAIVGAGSAGLMAGAVLANNGKKVAVFDSHYVAGGCATMFARKGKYRFDVGLHYLGDPDNFRKLLDKANVELPYVPMDQDGFDTLVFPDFEFRIPTQMEVFRERLIEFFPSEQKGIDRYIRMCVEVEALIELMGGPRKSNLQMLWHVARNGRLAAQYRDATLGTFLDSCTKDKKLQAVLSGQNGDYGVAPGRVSCMLHVGLAVHYFKGAWYPEGGGQSMSDKLAASIEANGGSVHLRRAVTNIPVSDGKAIGVDVQLRPREIKAGMSNRVTAKTVISGADYQLTMEKLLEGGKESVPLPKSYETAAGLIITALGVNRSPEQLREIGFRSTNYWCFNHYDFDNVYAAMSGPPQDQIPDLGVYITSGSLKDTPQSAEHHAPAGQSSVEVLSVVPWDANWWGASQAEIDSGAYRHNPAYKEKKAALEDRMIQRLAQQFPGLDADIVFKETATPLSHRRFTQGSPYGLAATPEQFFSKRPGAKTPVGGLFVCGHSTRSGHGIISAMSGGYTAARRALKYLAK